MDAADHLCEHTDFVDEGAAELLRQHDVEEAARPREQIHAFAGGEFQDIFNTSGHKTVPLTILNNSGDVSMS